MVHVTAFGIIYLFFTLASSLILDPITNFCRRFAHQTTVIDNILYIDGGLVDYGGSIDSTTVNHTNTYLLHANLSYVTNDWPVQRDDLAKPDNVPSVRGGALWADQVNKLFYLFGGDYDSTTQPPTQYTLWFFDVIYKTWNTTPTDASLGAISPPSFGASAVDDNEGTAYYYGGWTSNASEVGFNGNPKVQSSFISYNMDKKLWRSTVFVDDTPRAEGAMFYIPASDKGMLVYFGGIQQNTSNSSTTAGVPLDTVYLFDIGTQTSFSQKTSGGPPSNRRRFCGGVSWPEDRSSFNIYIYSGIPPYDEAGFGVNDVWILSIPSFTWTLVIQYPDHAHHSVSCNIVNSGQMLLIGGWFPDEANNECDAPTIWGMHNLDLGMVNHDAAAWYQYLPNITSYTVPPNLTAVIGGSGTGGATLTTPEGGFDSDELRIYLNRLAPTGHRTATRSISTSTPTPTSRPSKSKSNLGAILGGVLGGLAALILLLLLALFCLRRRKRAREVSPQNPPNRSSKHLPSLPLDNQRAAFTPKRPSISSATPHESPPPAWQPEYGIPPYQQQRFMEDLPQQHYPPPPLLPYYPPPALPQQYHTQVSSPIFVTEHTYEMPSVRSPPHEKSVTEGNGGANGRTYSSSGAKRRTTTTTTSSAHDRISEE